VHYINVVRKLEIFEVRKLPQAWNVGPLVCLPVSHETFPIGVRHESF
jgi:hypothetical protein